MKKFAARDFEDILQVSLRYEQFPLYCSNHPCPSVLFQYLTACSHQNISLQSFTYCLFLLIGMALRNFGCILI